MGCNNSSYITINLDRMNPMFSAGETVSGTSTVNIQEGDVKVDEIFIILEGEAGYTTTRHVDQGNGSSRIETDYHSVPFFRAKQILESPEKGHKEMVYHRGQYSWRFELLLPPQLPPSINQPKKYPHVRYFLKFVIDKPWYKRNSNQILYLTVFPRVNLSHNPQCLMGSMFGNHNRKDVNLRGNLNKLGYVPGESIMGTLEIENPRRIKLKEIQLSLTQHYKIECNSGKEKIFEIMLPGIVNRNDERILENFSAMTPLTPLPPSYQYHDGSPKAAYVEVVYFLKFDVKAEGMFTNFEASIPITIGTESNTNPHEYQLHQSNDEYPNSLTCYPEISMHRDEHPPNYYSTSK